MNRRDVLRLLGLATAAGLAGLAACTTSDDTTRRLRLAAGEPGGFYVEFARLLAAQLGPGASVLETSGSMRNVELVRTGGATLGLTQADIAEAAIAGRAPFGSAIPLRSIGRIYENYMQLVVAADSAVRAVADLAGRRVSLGATGSGAAIFGDRLLASAGVDAGDAVIEHHPLATATRRLADGRIDALLWSGGVPTPALAALSKSHPIRLIDLSDQVEPLRAEYGPAYRRVVVPAGSYRNPRPVATIGLPNLLVTAPALADDTAALVARTLVEAAPRLIPPSALGTQYLDLRSLIATGVVPLHPGAASAYRDLRG